MKSFRILLAALLPALLFTGCNKGREILDKLAKSKSSGSSAGASADGVTHLTAADFEAFTQRQGSVVLVDFYADWCGPCRQLGPLLEKIAAESDGKIVLGKVDVDKAGDLPRKMGVSGIPDVRIYRDGKQVDRFVGSMDEGSLREKILPHAKGLSAAPPAAPASGDGSPPAAPQPANDPSSKDWLPPGMQRR